MSNLRRSKIQGWYEFTRETCPICHKTGGCLIFEDGNKVACIRETSETRFSVKFPSWLHYLKAPKKVAKQEFVAARSKREDSHLNKVYKCLLSNLHLSDAHYGHLTNEQRKMTEQEIEIRNYKSLPEKPWQTVKEMSSEIMMEELIGVPGFFENSIGWSFAGRSGFMIPYRNEKNEIIGFQTRADIVPNEVKIDSGSFDSLHARVIQQPNLVQIFIDGDMVEEVELEKGVAHAVYQGTDYGWVTLGSGQKYFWVSSANKQNGTGAGDPLPYHIAIPTKQLQNWKTGETHKSKAVWITEGALKADVAAEHIAKVYEEEELLDVGSTVIGVPGINTWRCVLPALKNMEVERINIAIDMDVMSNPYVAVHTKSMLEELKALGFSVNFVIWNEEDGKGIDDLLISKRFPHIKRIF